MKLLAIDPATKTGWATKDAYGVWDLKVKADESMGMRLLRFRNKIHETVRIANIGVVAYERPAGRHTGAVIHHAKLVGIIESFCEDAGLEYKGYSATQIKKHATGKGNASKQLMLDCAHKELGYEGDDFDEADALWLYDLAVEDLGLDHS